MIVAVLKRRTPEGQTILHGIYSTVKKARTAATGIMQHLNMMAAKPGKWTVTEMENEIQFARNKDGQNLTIDFWEVDRALLDGQFVTL